MSRAQDNNRATDFFCHKCGEKTHDTDDCTSKRRLCFNCKKPGHESRNCPTPRSASAQKCHICGQTGHVQSKCVWRRCFKCEEFGHMARECKNRTKSKFKPHCLRCKGTNHITRDCLAHIAEETRKQAEAQPAAPPEPVHPERKPKNNPKTRKNAGPRPTPPKPSSTPCAEPHPHPKAAPAGKSEDDSENLGTAVKQNADMLKEYGNAAFKREDFDEAIIGYNQAIKICPEEGVYYANRAAAYVKQQKYALAQSDCQRAISLQSNSPTAKVYTRLARCQYALGNVTAAQASLRQALELEPDNDMAKIFRAKALTLQGHIRDFEGARARGHWRMAQTACDSCICAIVDEGGVVPPEWKCWDIELLIARGEWDNAVVKIDSETADMSTKADMMLLHGLVLFLTGKLDEALERLAAALRFDPDSPKIKGLRVRVKNTRKLKDDGNIFFKDEEWLSAIEKYSEALEVIGEHADEGNGGRIRATLLSNRAATYVKIQRRKEAMADVKASLLLCPESYKALRTRGAINLLGENYDAAIDDFKQAIEAADTESARRTMESLLRQAETQAKKFRNKPKDHYETLGLSRGCTEAQIKKAYKQASLKHHPDKGGSEEKFKLIVEAYAILSDPIERRSYDAKSADNLYQSYDSDEGEDEYDPHFKFKERSNYSQNKYNGYWPWD